MENRIKKTVITSILALFSVSVSLAQVRNQEIDTTLYSPEAVVTGSRNEVDIRHLPLSVTVVNKQQIKDRFEQSLLPVLTEQVPSLFTTSRGLMGYGVSTGAAGGISMRGVGGSPTTGMLVLIDGHPQYMGLMGHPISDAYQSMMAEKVEVVRGPASVLYGSNAMGGVINILTRKSIEDGYKGDFNVGYGSFNTFTSESINNFKHKKLSATLTGSYNRSDGHRENMNFEQYGGYAKVGYKFSSNWDLFTDMSLTHYNASNPGAVFAPIFDNDSQITRGVASLSLNNNYEKTSGALKLFYNWGHHVINDGYYADSEPKDYLFNSKDRMMGLTYYQSVSLFEGNSLTAGVDYQRFGGDAWNTYQSGEKSEIIDITEQEVAGYVDFRQNICNFVTLNAGLRLDYHTKSGANWVPQFGASFYPNSAGELKLIASRGFRNPTIKELFMFTPKNPDLLSESLWNYEVSWSQRFFKGALSYSVNLFYINGENMIQTAMVDGRPLNVNTGEIENFGLELTSSYRISNNFRLSANYSWLNMQNPVLAAPEHKFYAGLDFSKGRFNATASVQYINGLYTVVKPTVEQENYALLNLRGAYKVCDNVKIYVKGENLLNQDYQINYGFTMPGATVIGGVNVSF